jgi:hypothetical protein
MQYSAVASLRRLFAGEVVEVDGGLVRMSPAQRVALLGPPNSFNPRGRDLDGDQVTDLDRDRDGVWDGLDDFTPGPVSDDEILCGSGLPGDILQDGLQLEAWRRDQEPGSSAFQARLPIGLAPRSPVFCRALNALLALAAPGPSGSDAFLWHGGSADGTDADADGWPDALDACPTVADPSQGDADADGVGDACDSCVNVMNPRVASDFLTASPWATLTGGQRDDDHDGFGHKCDGDFPGTATGNVGPSDTAEFRPRSAGPRGRHLRLERHAAVRHLRPRRGRDPEHQSGRRGALQAPVGEPGRAELPDLSATLRGRTSRELQLVERRLECASSRGPVPPALAPRPVGARAGCRVEA